MGFCKEVEMRLKEDKSFGIRPEDVVFMPRGYQAPDECIQQFIYDTNAKYFDSESDVLLRDCIVIKVAGKDQAMGVCRFLCEYLYDAYKDGGWEQVRYIVQENLKLVRNVTLGKTIGNICEYSQIKDRLIIRPINYAKNRLKLKDKCYKLIGDIALVLYIIAEDTGQGLKTISIPQKLIEQWELEFNAVFDSAMLNTCQLAEPRLYLKPIELIVPDKEEGKFMEADGKNIIIPHLIVPTITTTRYTNGAIAIFYPRVKERLAELMGGDYYVVFTSMHEARVHYCKDVTPRMIQRTLKDMYRIYGEDDLLSKKVFRYSADKKVFETVEL